MKILLALAISGLLLLASFWESRLARKLRLENEALRNEAAEAERLAVENRDQERLASALAEPPKPADRNELLRLRNEIRQLRAQQDETDKLRAGNQRLAAELKSGRFAQRRITDEPGAVPREQWKFAGLATPEATVQSFFAAVTSGNLEELLRCATPEMAEQMRKQAEQEGDKFQKQYQEEFGKLATVSGFRIEHITPRGPNGDQVMVLVKVAANGASMPLPLRRVGHEWRLGD